MKIILISLLSGMVLAAQAGVPTLALTGTVVDASNAPAPSNRARLKAADAEVETTTGAAGKFRFGQEVPGSYEIHAAFPGFDPAVRRVRDGARRPKPPTIRLTLASHKEEQNVMKQDKTVPAQARGNGDTISVEPTLLDDVPVLDVNYLSAVGRFLDPGTSRVEGLSIVVDGMEMRNVGVTASALQEILIAAQDSGPLTLLTAEDDGPGLPETLGNAVLERGVRTEESAPGAGLGLSYVRERAEHYEGSIALAKPSPGGLRERHSVCRAGSG